MHYAINLLWIQNNGHSKHPNPYIYHTHKPTPIYNNQASSAQTRIENELFLPALRWAQNNPTASVFIWFDSTKVSEQSIANTEQLLTTYQQQHQINSIQLRDIMDIDVVRNNSLIFSNSMGLYARVDFLKIILGYHCLNNEGFAHCIYTDITQPLHYLNADSLFCNPALCALESHGILINYKCIGPYDAEKTCKIIKPNGGENQFIQFANNPYLIRALADIINAGIIQAAHQLQQPAHEMGHFYVNFFQYVTGGQGHVSIQKLYHSYKNQCCYINADATVLSDHSLFKNTSGWVLFSTQRFGYLALGTSYQSDTYKLLCQTKSADGRVLCVDAETLLQLPKIDNLARFDIYYRDGRNHIDRIRKTVTDPVTPTLL